MSSRKMDINSSSSEDLEAKNGKIIDEKKRKRMISNRESARRSRMKREQHIKDLNDKITYFRSRRSQVVKKIDEIEQRYVVVDSENRVLRMHYQEMKKRLELLEQMLVSYNMMNSCKESEVVTNNNDLDEDLFEIIGFLQNDPLHKQCLQYSPLQNQTVDGIYQV